MRQEFIDFKSWTPADQIQLEDSGLSVITDYKQNYIVTAGPGAGKTELLPQKADFLLKTNSCHYPQKILAISFKKDARRNLKERVQLRSGPELASRFESHTYDSFAKDILDRFRLTLPAKWRPPDDYQIDFKNDATLADLSRLSLKGSQESRSIF